MTEDKKWFQSKTKVGAVLVGVSAVVGTIGAFLQGSVDMMPAVQALITEIGAVLLAMGIRDIPFLNKAK